MMLICVAVVPEVLRPGPGGLQCVHALIPALALSHLLRLVMGLKLCRMSGLYGEMGPGGWTPSS